MIEALRNRNGSVMPEKGARCYLVFCQDITDRQGRTNFSLADHRWLMLKTFEYRWVAASGKPPIDDGS